MDVLQIIQTVGFPIAVAIACGWFIYTKDKRVADEAKAREDRLLDANIKSAESLNKIADTIEDSNKVNKELSETNRLLVDEMKNKITNVDNNVSKILDKVNKE